MTFNFFNFPAYETINDVQSDIFLYKTEETCDNRLESLLKERQEMLSSILSTAKPVTGQGFFSIDRPMITSIIGAATTYIVVLIQFNISEKPICP
jgi:7tm Chemosensory receptor